MSKRSLLAAAATVLLCGCSLAPDYSVPTTPVVSATFREAGEWTRASPADALPKGTWWTLYGDAELNALEARIDTENPTLAAALDRYDAARAYVAEARSAYYPLIGTSNSFMQNRQSDNRPLRGANEPDYYGADTVGAQISYELDIWGNIRNQVAAGKAQAQAAAADAGFVRISLETDLASVYFSLRQSDSESALLQQAAAAYGRALVMTQQRHDGGIASGLDEGRAQSQLSDARARFAEAAAVRALYEHAIASLVGVPATDFSIAAARLNANVPNIPAGLPSTLLQRRPDIASAERRVAASNANIGVARAAFYPEVTLAATGGFQNSGQPGLLAAPNLFWTIGPSLAMTLFDAGAHQAELDITKAEHNEAAAQYRESVLEAFQDVEDDLALLNHLARAAHDEGDAVHAADRTEQLSLARYRLGAVNYLDVVIAQTAALGAQLNALDIAARRLQASVHLVKAIGGGWAIKDLPEGGEPYVMPLRASLADITPLPSH
jgi:NodT family efflux transporter outer membrane factor (OMF) lipoprotein